MNIRSKMAAVAVSALSALGMVAFAAGPAMASTGSAGQAGVQATGTSFRFVTGSVYGRNAQPFAPEVAGTGGSVSLWISNGTLVLLGISTGTGAANEPYSPGINVYQNHTLVASQNDPSVNGVTCPAGQPCTPGDTANWAAQQTYTLQLFYDRGAGTVDFQARDAHGDVYRGFYQIGPVSFTRAQVSTDFGDTPFDAAGYTAAPASQLSYLTWRNISLTSTSGRHGSFTAFAHHHVVLVSAPGGAKAGSLSSGGSAFHTYLTP